MKSNLSDRVIDKAIRVAYGEAHFWERMQVARWAKDDTRILLLIEEHRQVAEMIRAMDRYKLEDDAFRNRILHSIEKENANKKRPFLIASGLAGFATIVVLALLLPSKIKVEETHPYSRLEIEAATDQVMQALNLVSYAVNDTRDLVQNDIVEQRIGSTLQKSSQSINEHLLN